MSNVNSTFVLPEKMTSTERKAMAEKLRQEALAAYNHATELADYHRARKSGMTHEESIAAARSRAAQRAATSKEKQLEDMRRDLAQHVAVGE